MIILQKSRWTAFGSFMSWLIGTSAKLTALEGL